MVASFTRLGLNPRLATDYDPATGIHTLKITGGGGGGGIPSIAGTANQIVQVGSPGAVTLSIAGTFTFPGTVTNNLSIFGATTSAQLAGIISDETGTGPLVFANSPTLVTPALGTPSALVLTNATGTPTSIGLANATGLSLTTGVTGTLPILNGGTGQTTANAAFNALSPMTTGGDLIYGGAAGVGTRLANGTAGQLLQSNGTTLAPTWVAAPTSGVTSIIGTANQINQSGSPGATTLTLSSTIQLPGSMTIGGGTIGTDKLEVTGSVTFNTGPVNFISAPIVISGNISQAAWTTSGIRIKGTSGTLTDTTSSGTVAAAYTDVLGGNTIAASNATTFTQYVSSYFRDPVAGANVTLTNKNALGADSALIGNSASALLIKTTGNLEKLNSTDLIITTGGTDALAITKNSPRQIQTLNTGVFGWSSSGSVNAAPDLVLSRSATATLQLGNANAASPVAQTIQSQGSRAGTDTNVGGANFTVQSGTGTGTGAPSTLVLKSPVAVGSGTGAQTLTTGLLINVGTAVLSSYTVATLPAAATAGAGATAFVTDASTTIILGLGAAVVGGGANKVPVYSDGTNWIIG